MRASTSPASLRGGRPVRRGDRLCQRAAVGNPAITFSGPHPWGRLPRYGGPPAHLDLCPASPLVKERNGIVSFLGQPSADAGRHRQEIERWQYRHKIEIAAGQGSSEVQRGSKPARPLGRRVSLSGPPQTPVSSAPERRRRERRPLTSGASWKCRRSAKTTTRNESRNAAMSPAADFCGGTLRSRSVLFSLCWRESTDDAFVAARQFPIAPKVSGSITAVP